jgi:simple sugar transport system permease protein
VRASTPEAQLRALAAMSERLSTAPVYEAPATAAAADLALRARRWAEHLLIPLFALGVSALLFSAFLLTLGKSPGEFWSLVWRGGFGTAFSWQNTLLRAGPLVLTALCVAVPARIGLVVIGGEGAVVIGGFCAAAVAVPLIDLGQPWLVLSAMAAAAVAAGGLWIGLVGLMRHARGVNETISSLLMTYIAVAIMSFFIEGVLRDPADPNRPATRAIGPENMIGNIPGLDVHWGLVASLAAALVLYVLMHHTTFGFAARVAGGSVRVALAQGLPVGKMIVVCCVIAGACAGLAGFFEVAAIHGKANAALRTGYGFTGILVSFLARHNPLTIVPVAVLFGGIAAAGGLVQRRMDLPDATVLLLQGLVFVVLLASETLHGRFRIFDPAVQAERT